MELDAEDPANSAFLRRLLVVVPSNVRAALELMLVSHQRLTRWPSP
jgi:hypothetical protein